MLGLFKKKTQKEVLLDKYNKLMKESHRLSTINRAEADRKYAEAEELLKEVDQLEK